MKENFCLKDLEEGMLVRTYSYGYMLVTKLLNGELVIANNDGFIRLKSYRNDLTNMDEDCKILTVYSKADECLSLGLFDPNYRNILWERPKKKKMTLKEIEKELGYEIELVLPSNLEIL